MQLSGKWLWPPQDEINALIEANSGYDPVEAVMRLRALVEISNHLDSRSLMLLASYRPEEHREVARLLSAGVKGAIKPQDHDQDKGPG